ncbi:TRAP transporter large permease [Skermanella mucosa]|uniref:TRAP transporter large permease n=1 Tax=Skermanella mucosa TaxID=1789672 RepID=UPI00192CB553|nr:TRAP transporter large permease [Skermanella mucosa]UEM21993.1 TRAP transporter large permease [Skermanella mucosa]
MTELQIGSLILVCTTLVLFSGIPIAFGLTVVSIAFLYVFDGPGSLSAVPRTFLDEISGFALLAVPMFVLLGSLIGSSRAGADIYEALHRWLARVPGGLVIANIGACGLFSALSGSSPATAAAIGKVGVPEMLKRGCPAGLATGAIAAGGTLGILIPPSVTMILYGVATETSIGRLFVAGVVPGVLLVVVFCVYAWAATAFAERHVDQPRDHYTLKEKIRASGTVAPLFGIIALIIVALYGGYATPSEIAALAAMLAFLYVALVYRIVNRENLWPIFGNAVRESCMILLIIAASGLFSYMMSLLYVTQTMADMLVGWELNRWVMLLVVNVFLLVAGCFLPPVALILMTMPILQPVLEANNFDMIWFGVLMTINLEIGLITPPVGLNLYILRNVAPQVPLMTVLWGSVPFVLIMMGFMVLLCFVPGIALWLPNQMFGP